ncbi:glucan endo-1,3-beta-glucosidase 12-like [Chenopodium quinoa]|uniref:glucan endo-1,3-beta-glucosidase 12-like n=1 Tax=Chenopodium quinoa TaxID=63459 RepID=UPI000B77DA69|nr:glucan endo-1,3-beta-glucosidase 12-like [Chenopodium quinoa]
MAVFFRARPTRLDFIIVLVSIFVFSLFNICDAGRSLERFKLMAGLKFSYFQNPESDTFDLPTLDAYDNDSWLAPSPLAPTPSNLISNPPDNSPSPSPYAAPPMSGPPVSDASPTPGGPVVLHPGPSQLSLQPAGPPRHGWGQPGHEYAVWCVARPTVPETMLQRAMDYACGNGADCGSVQPNGPCFVPNNLVAHASYAFNSYWQRVKIAGGTCDFGGTAMLITVDPSFNACHFIYN